MYIEEHNRLPTPTVAVRHRGVGYAHMSSLFLSLSLSLSLSSISFVSALVHRKKHKCVSRVAIIYLASIAARTSKDSSDFVTYSSSMWKFR